MKAQLLNGLYTWEDFTWGQSTYVKSSHIIGSENTIIRWGFMCELWPHVKSPQVNNRLYSGLTLLKFDPAIHRNLWPHVKSSHIIASENTIIRWGFMCELWPHVKSPQVNYRLHSGLTLLKINYILSYTESCFDPMPIIIILYTTRSIFGGGGGCGGCGGSIQIASS